MSLCTYGPGAGQKPTATSVVADIVRIVRRLNDGTIGKDFNEYSRDLVLANPEDVKANYYFSILAPDSKGQVLEIWLKSSMLKIFPSSKSFKMAKKGIRRVS